jgi:hypothetical protein
VSSSTAYAGPINLSFSTDTGHLPEYFLWRGKGYAIEKY